MTVRPLAAVVAGALLLSTAAAAESVPPAELCELYARDLRYDLLLIADNHPRSGPATNALDRGEALCLEGEVEAGIEMLKSGIAGLGLPVPFYE